MALAGCGFGGSRSIDTLRADGQQVTARHIDVEVANLETGLPCKVVDRRDAASRNVLWRAEFDADFCRRKAEETRLVLENKGWACQRQDEGERQNLVQATTTRPDERSHIVAAWRCIEGLQPFHPSVANRPPLPLAKPDLKKNRTAGWGDKRLRGAVAEDLAAIGQSVVDDETAVDTALGDLNDDGIDDAIVVLTRHADPAPPHRMLMAYLQNGDAYHLVDVWILDTPSDKTADKLTVAVEDGLVRLEDCCEDRQDPTVLVLDDRKLSYAQGG